MAQHALGCEDDQRLAPQAAHLPAQQVEILRGGRGLANLHVVFGGELHEALHARAGMLWSLALVAVRQKLHDAGRQIPFIFTCADELVDDDLRAVRKIAELRFPENERLGIVAAKAVFETEAASLGKRRVVDFAERLIGRKMGERNVIVFGHRIDQNSVALVERAALRILPGKADRIAFQNDGTKSQRFREAIIDGALSVAHLGALLEQFYDLRMYMEAVRYAHQAGSDFFKRFTRKAGIDLIFGLVAAVEIRRPVFR